jgi:hypothetical protein
MLAVPSALLLLAMGFLNSPVAASVSSVGDSPATGAVVVLCHVESSNSLPTETLASITSGLSLSRIARRKSRLKALIEEESDREFEEVDLGPVDVPKRDNSPPSNHFVHPFLATTCRLRC